MTYLRKNHLITEQTTTEHKTPPSRQDTACAWLIENDLVELPQEENAEFQAWLNQDSRNLGAYIRAQVHFESLNYVHSTPLTTEYVPAPPRPRTRRTVLYNAMFMGAAGLAFMVQPQNTGKDETIILKNSKLLPRHFSLNKDDLVLDVHTEAHSNHTPTKLVANIVKGRMGLTVNNALHIYAGNIIFSGDCVDCDVSVTRSALELTLYSGSLFWQNASAQGESHAPSLWTFKKDRKKGFTSESAPLAQNDIQKYKAWRRNQIIFDKTTLSDATALLNRYTTRPVRIASTRLAQAHVSGTFGLGMPEEFAQAVCTLFQCRQHLHAHDITLTDI